MVQCKSPNWGCSPSKWPKWGLLTTYKSWDDPPSMVYIMMFCMTLLLCSAFHLSILSEVRLLNFLQWFGCVSPLPIDFSVVGSVNRYHYTKHCIIAILPEWSHCITGMDKWDVKKLALNLNRWANLLTMPYNNPHMTTMGPQNLHFWKCLW